MFSEISRFLKNQNRLTKLITIFVVITGIVLYSLMGIIYKNYKINKQMEDLNSEITRLEKDNIEQESKMLYYSTNAYIERALREKLGYQKNGERVYALPRKDPEREKLIKEQKEYQEKEENKPNPVKWFNFFFAKKEVIQLNTDQIPDENMNTSSNTDTPVVKPN